jgi:hypothetical protein
MDHRWSIRLAAWHKGDDLELEASSAASLAKDAMLYLKYVFVPVM